MDADSLRKKFLDFFAAKDHKIVASDSLVPKDDPTLLFTTAGMNQFKKQFLGNVASFRRAATCQRCLRTDDLDKVGKTPAHHTFFEMLGNFSFGDYFKQEAIAWAWEFLTQVLGIGKEKLWVSVYDEDDEAYKVWLDKIKLPPAKIIKLGDKENFWPSQAKTKGPNGPCGPCSEIFYDYGKDIGCGSPDCSPACNCGRFVEVWNLVFTQFNRKPDGTLEELPKKNIDTGMGLERLSAVMQGVYNNFDTDLFTPIIEAIKKESRISKPGPEQTAVFRILSDHTRAIAFAICDGVNPSNEERGYVIKKLIRIGVNNYRSLGIKRAFLYKIVPAVCETMKQAYPELLQRRENISEIIKKEEEAFLKIVEEKSASVKQEIKALAEATKDPGLLPQELAKLAFQLYDTYGFPLEATVVSATALGLTIDKNKFDNLMQEQKQRSRAASTMTGNVFSETALKVNALKTEFAGFDNANLKLRAKIIKMFSAQNQEINSSEGEPDITVILDKTPFYGESGGQAGDSGLIEKDGNKLEITDSKRIEGAIIHMAKVVKGEFKVGDEVTAEVDSARRLEIARNHTATHLLQSALRKVLGEHVKQQGSFVSSDRLRFDFTHFKAVTQDEINRAEEVVNGLIRDNIALSVRQMPLSEAKKTGALAFFAEKYEESVRVVSIADFSQELCGGTHLASTGQIGLFKITNEGSIAQGIRRIEAASGEAAFKLMKDDEAILKEITSLLNTEKEKIIPTAASLIEARKILEKKLNQSKIEAFGGSVPGIIAKAKEINSAKIIIQKFNDADMDFLRAACDLFKQKTDNALICLASTQADKAVIVLGVSHGLVKKGLDAGQIIKEIAAFMGGSGGGRPDLAQAGSSQKEKLDEALKKFEAMIEGKLK